MASQGIDYDQTFKRLLTQAHDSVLAWLFPKARWVEARPTELGANGRIADLVWEVVLPFNESVLLHIEIQTDADPLIGERVAE